jgi:hypothetical protein
LLREAAVVPPRPEILMRLLRVATVLLLLLQELLLLAQVVEVGGEFLEPPRPEVLVVVVLVLFGAFQTLQAELLTRVVAGVAAMRLLAEQLVPAVLV